MSQDPSQESNQPEQEGVGRSPAEWFTFTVSSVILTVVVGLVGYVWISQGDRPPILSVTHNDTNLRTVNGQFYIPFEVRNDGGKTAESVQIIAELQINGKTDQMGEQMIDFLSSGETEEGEFVFNQNPRQGQLTIRVASYKVP